MNSLTRIVEQNDRLYFLLLELLEWLKSRFAPPSLPNTERLSRYGAQTMHVPSPDCEIHESKRRVVHIRDLVLEEGQWLMDTVAVCSRLGVSRTTLMAHRVQGLLTEVRMGQKGGAVRFISSEVESLREWYSVPKGKV